MTSENWRIRKIQPEKHSREKEQKVQRHWFWEDLVDPMNTQTTVAGLQCDHRVVGDEAESGTKPDVESLMNHGKDFEFYF